MAQLQVTLRKLFHFINSISVTVCQVYSMCDVQYCVKKAAVIDRTRRSTYTTELQYLASIKAMQILSFINF